MCTAELRILAPGAEAMLSEPTTLAWRPGQYHLVATVERLGSGTREEVATPPFTVTC